MTKAKMSFLALLLVPAATFAKTVDVDWTGQIAAYEANGSAYPQTLSDTSVSGVFTINTGLLPAPDAGNPLGVLSFTGSGFLQSSVHWSGGPFAAEPFGSTGSNSLSLDINQNLCTIQDSSTYVDALGTTHQAVLSLSVMGLLGFVSSGSAGGTSGSGFFADVTVPGDEGFVAAFSTDSVTVKTVGVPEPDTLSLSVAMLLVVGVALIRGRRKASLPR